MTVWLRPATLDEAVALTDAGATPVGGGAALMSAAFAPRFAGKAVDLTGMLPDGVDRGFVGAATTLDTLGRHAGVRRDFRAVTEAAGCAGTPQVRRLATVGGTIALRSLTADLYAALAVHEPSVRVLDVDGVRSVTLTDYLVTEQPRPHLVLGVQLDVVGRSAYRRFATTAGPGVPLATAAARLDRTCGDSSLQLVAGACGTTPAPIELDAADVPCEVLRDDVRASASFRRQLIRALAADLRAELT